MDNEDIAYFQTKLKNNCHKNKNFSVLFKKKNLIFNKLTFSFFEISSRFLIYS